MSESELKKQLKFRDLKRFFKRAKEELGDDSILSDAEDYVREKVIDILIDGVVDDPLYEILIRKLIDEIESALD